MNKTAALEIHAAHLEANKIEPVTLYDCEKQEIGKVNPYNCIVEVFAYPYENEIRLAYVSDDWDNRMEWTGYAITQPEVNNVKALKLYNHIQNQLAAERARREAT